MASTGEDGRTVGSSKPSLEGPPDFPANVPIIQSPYENWAEDLSLSNVWTCSPESPQDVVTVCNWAAAHGFRVRARGCMHGWSPLTVTAGMSTQSLLLVDLTRSFIATSFIPAAAGQPPAVRAGTGVLMIDLLTFLEEQSGGGGSAPGYSFPHTPAPGSLTLGGVLAINAHGTAVPTPGVENMPSGYGSMSNRILEFTAVVSDPGAPTQYGLRTFHRGEGDDKAFLAHLGRAMIVEAVLEVAPNYMLRCESLTNVPATTLFAAPTGAAPPANSFADYVDRCGRVEIIWFPFTDYPWLHLWQVSPEKPPTSRETTVPYNYPFADNLDPVLEGILRTVFESGYLAALTPMFGQMTFDATSRGLDGKNLLGWTSYPVSRDLWGTSKNLLLYIKDTTLRVTANGYAVQLKRADLQQAVHDFTSEFTALLSKYQAKGQYPINSPLEIRVTGLDDPAAITVPKGQTATSPVISSLSQDAVSTANEWDVALWLDVLTIPGTPNANDFFADLEQWLLQRFSGGAGRVLPEWSKGWGYEASTGAWTSAAFLQHVRTAYTTGREDNNTWNWEVATLRKYDGANLFSNDFLDRLFTPGGLT